jgi:hypothetical protein
MRDHQNPILRSTYFGYFIRSATSSHSDRCAVLAALLPCDREPGGLNLTPFFRGPRVRSPRSSSSAVRVLTRVGVELDQARPDAAYPALCASHMDEAHRGSYNAPSLPGRPWDPYCTASRRALPSLTRTAYAAPFQGRLGRAALPIEGEDFGSMPEMQR